MRHSGRQSLADQAFTRLEELIVTLVLAPGMTLSENELCDRLKIGRTPVREALQRLRNAHLVEIIPRFGVRIAETNVEDQLLLLEVRREVERLVVSSAARRSTDAERAECKRMAEGLTSKEKHGVVEFLRYHHQVRRYITAIARNPYAEQVILPFYASSRRFYYLHYLQSRDIPLAAEYHARVIRAIARGDEARAAAASDLVIDYAVAITRAVVGNLVPTQPEHEPPHHAPIANISRRKA
jgi:DNA-binding GntR family transcriptional regulator